MSEKVIELFREKGYDNVSVAMICKACGVTS
ncbi:MAG: TetR family transcriptional regulator [Eggerthellaceae bacterium]|nr:TetR family transcriptional regulator [Eggerthellaceae bacterium]